MQTDLLQQRSVNFPFELFKAHGSANDMADR